MVVILIYGYFWYFLGMSDNGFGFPDRITRRWRFNMMTTEEVHDYLRKEKSRELPPISAFVMAAKDLGLIEEYDKSRGLIDVHWCVLRELFGFSQAEMMLLMEKSKCRLVRSVSEFDSRLKCLVFLERFRLEEIDFDMLRRAFLGEIVRNIIFQRPQEPDVVTDVHVSVYDLMTPKHNPLCPRCYNRADFIRIHTLFECFRDGRVNEDIIGQFRQRFVEWFPHIGYIVYFFA